MFQSRIEAGQKLAEEIKKQLPNLNPNNFLILALPRGGVVVGSEVAKALKIPFDIIIVRKIGHPTNPEYAIGAVGESGKIEIKKRGISKNYLKKVLETEKKEIQRRSKEYRGTKKSSEVGGKIIVLIDDGLATGLTMKVAIKEVKEKNPQKIIIAMPVAPKESINELKKEVDQVICLEVPEFFTAVSSSYTTFEQVTDQEVIEALKCSNN